MSTGIPPAAEVASTSISASASPATRFTGRATPVDVSLCGHAYASKPAAPRGSTPLPYSTRRTSCSDRNGAAAVTAANFAENSPHTTCCTRDSTRLNVATSPPPPPPGGPGGGRSLWRPPHAAPPPPPPGGPPLSPPPPRRPSCSDRNGAAAVTAANFAENSPHTTCCTRDSTRLNVATSQ